MKHSQSTLFNHSNHTSIISVELFNHQGQLVGNPVFSEMSLQALTAINLDLYSKIVLVDKEYKRIEIVRKQTPPTFKR